MSKAFALKSLLAPSILLLIPELLKIFLQFDVFGSVLRSFFNRKSLRHLLPERRVSFTKNKYFETCKLHFLL